MDAISARTNEKIKYAVRLRESAAFRREQQRFLIEGARLCFDAAQSGVRITQAFLLPEALQKYGQYTDAILGAAESRCEISIPVAAALADTKSPQGIFCVCEVPAAAPDILPTGTYLALDRLQDPANVGGILRSCEALGGSSLIVGGGCDPYHPKTLRAAMGSAFRVPLISTENLPELLIFAGGQGMLTMATMPRADALDLCALPKSGGKIAVIGNEGGGISDEVLSVCNTAVRIPMAGKAESLNAAAAAAILLWEMLRENP